MDQQITAQTVSLPKGGGAIQGIGETFQASEFTGTASLSIPIGTSSCRGFEPTISVDYSSGSGNGSFGLGFTVSIPKISCKTSKGLPKYDGSDTFLLNGDDLVPIVGGQRAESVNTIQYTVLSYRPRREGQFATIEQWLAPEGDSYWRIVSSDNVTSIFGKTENSRLVDPANPHHIFEWHVSETFTPSGEHVVYDYKSENTDNIPNDLCEVNRTQTANKYIERIQYGNVHPFAPGQAAGDDWRFEVVFDYGEYHLDSDTPYIPVRAWSRRQDSFSTYHSGFEIRTHRLCRSILMFHRFDAELGREPILVKATRFFYEETPVVSLMSGVESIGYSHENGHYITKKLPPLEFKYTEFQPQNHPFEPLLSEKGDSLPGLSLSPNYSLIDLYGEGIPGILYSDRETTLYLEPIAQDDNVKDEAPIRYSSPRVAQTFPIEGSGESATERLMDLTGNGQMNLVVSKGSVTGYYEANADRSWQTFQTFPSFPTDFSDPNNQLLDMTGDGLTDVVRMDSERIRIYPGKGKDGFGPLFSRTKGKEIPLKRAGAEDEVLRFTDIFGTGMQHLVRVMNGTVECWPHLGYGSFGERVLLDNAPHYGERLDASRLFLADIDGSGTADLIYVHSDRVEIWFNQSGNQFSEPMTLHLPSQWESLNQIQFADVYGNGTTCLVFSDNHINPRHWCYDFCQRRKPYLLNETNNNLGSKSTITYCSSTKFYLADKQNGTPWIVNLPFPVQVVEKTESIDLISGSKLVSSYRYHHGHYDGVEREFCGFGLVERQDAETLEDLLNSGSTQAERDFYVPPILTKTWHHTGAWQEHGSLSRQYEQEYFQGDAQAYLFPDSLFADLAGEVDAETSRQAYFTLKGRVLRQEVYGLDASELSDKPYTVTETNYHVKPLQAKGANRYGIYFVEPRETLSYQYERNAADPRISHQFVLKVDEVGNVLRSCSVAYGRRNVGDNVFPEQQAIRVTSAESTVINLTTEAVNLLGVPLENKSYEITNLALSPGEQYFRFAEIASYIEAALEETVESDNATLLGWQRNYYWSPETQAALPLGEVTPEALLYQTEAAEFSREEALDTFSSVLSPERLEDLLSTKGGYQLKEGYWWNPGATQTYHSADQFFLPNATFDAFGHATTYTYDPHHLMTVTVTDALANQTVVETIDYQTLQPQRIRDINDNISEVRLDPLGMVVVSSFYGTENGEPQGFAPLDDYRMRALPTLDELMANPQDYLQGAASYFYYDLFAWKEHQVPVHSVNLTPEDYGNNGGNNGRILTSIAYSDGFGRDVQSQVKADAGPAFFVTADGEIETRVSEDRWLTSGHTVYDNKGNPVRQFEPYYLDTYAYVNNETLNQFGISDTLFYDPLGRNIQTETAKGFLSRVEFTPWEQKSFDENDTVRDSPFYQDFLANYPDNPTEEQRHEKDALDKAAVFYDTPVVSIVDSLGNAFLINDNGLTSCYKYDIQGRLIESVDPRLHATNLAEGTTYYNFRYQYPMMGATPWVTDSADGGVNLSFNNVFGNHLWNRSPRNFEQVIDYDELQRQLKVRTKGIKNDGTIATDNVVETYVYGESQPNAEDFNLRGELYQLRDQSGLVTNRQYNIQGNLIETSRQLTKNYKDYVNWEDEVELEDEIYTDMVVLNAIQQSIAETTPDGSVTTNRYNVLGLLEGVTVTLPDGTVAPIINQIDYDTKGQRLAIDYANGVKTTYRYEESTFRLIQMRSTRANQDSRGESRSAVLQDIVYAYDPVGNLTRLKDNTYETVFFNNQRVQPLSDYTYDVHYRLIEASGRQHPGINANTHKGNEQQEQGFKQSHFVPLSESTALENYHESYTYDDAGNLIKTTHTATNAWTRTQEVMPDSNRLQSVSSRSQGTTDSLPITYDRSGNQQQLNGNSTMQLTFNCCENLTQARIIEREALPNDSDYYTYDSDEMRTRKVSERLINGGAVIEKESKLYFDNYEVKRLQTQTADGETTLLMRHTLRVMDDETCVAIFHTWEVDERQREVQQPGTRKMRFQMGNYLGSVALEVDDEAQVISYEEYFPYGGTAFIAGKNQKEVKLKDYRYSGKERDDSTGLYYYGARYYAPWLGRWLKPDPAGTVDGLNLYQFVGSNPISFNDPNGLQRQPSAPTQSWRGVLRKILQNIRRIGRRRRRGQGLEEIGRPPAQVQMQPRRRSASLSRRRRGTSALTPRPNTADTKTTPSLTMSRQSGQQLRTTPFRRSSWDRVEQASLETSD
ncbi:MAG: SpvB/TcaC N-terminal domain-containing protein, partial [Cyanobacteria bacterium J06628_4]